MRKYHVCDTTRKSGIARYGIDFHAVVLGPLGYTLIDPRDVTPALLDTCPPTTPFHVELGAMQFEECDALLRILRSGHCQVDATLHDPPFLTFPFFHFESEGLRQLSRGIEWYLGSFGFQDRTLRRLRRVFVLSQSGAESLKTKGIRELQRIPHVVAPDTIWASAHSGSRDIAFFGFVGPSKGIEYALELHERIDATQPPVHMHVVGEATGKAEKKFLARLRSRFRSRVTYHGYVPDAQLDSIFASVRHVFLPFEEHKYFRPTSGSVINSLKRGRVVWTTPANSVAEIITHRHNGMFLTKQIDTDAAAFLALASQPAELDILGENALETAREMAVYPYRRHFDHATDFFVDRNGPWPT